MKGYIGLYLFYLLLCCDVCVQTMNMLMVYQSIIDIGASLFPLLMAVIDVDAEHMSRTSTFDQFICYFWHTRQPSYYFITLSTYGILAMTLDRYVAVIYPIWYNNHVRTATVNSFYFAIFSSTPCQDVIIVYLFKAESIHSFIHLFI